MSTQSPLPPSERDFEVYRLVKVELRSTREAAAAVGISQTRVCQVIERTAAFLIDVAPTVSEEKKEKQLTVARQVAAERLDYFIQECFLSFRRSQTVVTTVREVASQQQGRVTVSTAKASCGDVRYLVAAAKLSVLAAKLPAASLSHGVGGEAGDAGGEAREAGEGMVSSPDGDCSVEAGEQGAAGSVVALAEVTSDSPIATCVQALLAARDAEKCSARPVQEVRNNPLGVRRELARKQFLANT